MQTINPLEGVEKREPSYLVGVNEEKQTQRFKGQTCGLRDKLGGWK